MAEHEDLEILFPVSAVGCEAKDTAHQHVDKGQQHPRILRIEHRSAPVKERRG